MNENIIPVDQPVIVTIDTIIQESEDTKTFIFKHHLDYKIGQFIMVWLPGIDEKPFAVSKHGNDHFGISALARGNFTRIMHNLRTGGRVGIRGPFGNGFSIPDSIKNGSKNACVIGGGCGMASLTTLIEELKRNSIQQNKITIINGALSKTKLLFSNMFKDVILFTDDGSIGEKGYPTNILDDLHKKHRFQIIYTCGPEIMMFKVHEFCKKNNIECEASLERYMKCGIGICGQCVCDGKMVCKDGPVFNLESLSVMSDFGKYSLLKSGKKVSIKYYGEWREV